MDGGVVAIPSCSPTGSLMGRHVGAIGWDIRCQAGCPDHPRFPCILGTSLVPDNPGRGSLSTAMAEELQ